MTHSGETAAERAPVTPPTSAKMPVSWPAMVAAAALAIPIIYLYSDVLYRLGRDWWNDPNFSHGFFVPVFSLFVLWQQKDELKKVSVKPSWWGAFFAAGSLAMLVVGILGAEFFLARTSFVFLLGSLIVQFYGWRMLRTVLFAWAVLFLMIPIPAVIFNQIAFPLQLLASQLATSLLSVFGVPVLREGNVIRLPVMSLEVAEACSGIRSLVSLTTLAVIYGYFIEPRTSRRVWMAIFAVPIAVIANGLRIMGTGLVAQYWDPTKAEGFFHEFSGWIIFILSLGMLLMVHRLMGVFDRFRKGAQA